MPKRVILFVNFSKTWGGGENWHLISAAALAARGYPVHLLVRQGSALHTAGQQQPLACIGVRVSALGLLDPFLWRACWHWLARLQPTTVILNGSRELKTVGLLARWRGVPQIIYRRGIPRPIQPTALNRWLFRQVVTTVVVNSQHTADAMQGILQAVRKPSPNIIYNGMACPASPSCANATSLTVAVVARLSHEKGVDLALRAFAHVHAQMPAVRLMIIGDGPERQALADLSAALHLTDHVIFTGFTTNVTAYLQQCALLLMPSRWEGFGFTLLEAMLLSMPCLAFAGNSADEIIQEGVTGYLLPPHDLAALADRIVTLLQNPDRIRAMGQAGYARLVTHFSLPVTTDALERILI